MIIGIVGKTNTGKSTFFKALTLAEVEISNRPFVTIKPNHGTGYLKIKCIDKEFNIKCNPKKGYCSNNFRFVPVELIDVAGLVPEAHKGYGLGLEFLNDLNQADALIHIIDVSGSTNAQGEEVEKASYDPANDIKFLEIELDMWYLNIIKKNWGKFARQVKQENLEIHKALAKQLSGIKVTEEIVNNAIKKLNLNKEPITWQESDLKNLATELRKQTKPMLIAANKIDIDIKNNFERLKKEFPNYMIIACSAESELALKEASKYNLIKYIPGDNKFEIIGNLNEQQKKALKFIKEKILDKFNSTGIQDVLNFVVFNLLKCIAVYPVENENKLTDSENNVLPDVYLLPEKSTALDLAFKIHTNIGERFIGAIDVRTKKRLSKDYQVKNNDVLKILTN